MKVGSSLIKTKNFNEVGDVVFHKALDLYKRIADYENQLVCINKIIGMQRMTGVRNKEHDRIKGEILEKIESKKKVQLIITEGRLS